MMMIRATTVYRLVIRRDKNNRPTAASVRMRVPFCQTTRGGGLPVALQRNSTDSPAVTLLYRGSSPSIRGATDQQLTITPDRQSRGMMTLNTF